ncbi:MAG TPA: hypothetical protein VKY92_02330 [Verrucomicrobiae bacterium]|nr:hypothetical protein [Verrucomicrobiae bacterium]
MPIRTRSRFFIAAFPTAMLLMLDLAFAQSSRFIFPSQTDPNITDFNKVHLAAINTNVPAREHLFLFLPGTGGVPAGYTNVVRTAANLGLHAIGLMYVNGTTVNSLCDQATNSDCFREIRLDIIQGGTNTDPAFSVSRADSIENRAVKLLQYLSAKYPAEGWGQYLDSNTNLVWSQILIAGHSQGAGHAGLIAKLHPVVRSIMFADTDWWFPGNRPADWIYQAGVTSNELFFGFIHVQDPLVLYSYEIPTWAAYEMNAFGPALLVESNAPPFLGSHMLTTDLPTQNNQTGQAYHGATVTDPATPLQPDGTPVYEPVWHWMMTGPSVLTQLSISWQSTNVMLGFGTSAGNIYQIQESDGVSSAWSNSVPAITGNGQAQSITLPVRAAPRLYRVAVQY